MIMEADKVCLKKENQMGDKDLREDSQNSFPFPFSRLVEGGFLYTHCYNDVEYSLQWW